MSRSFDGGRILEGEAKWSRKPLRAVDLGDAAAKLTGRALPPPVDED